MASHKRSKAPTGKAGKKPPKPDGYFWRPHGVGHDLKKHVFVANHNGEKIRREIYVAHLGREEFAEMKKRHKGKALDDAISRWVAEHDR